jgi:ADP-heptose:LPS heptosyltransferase
MSHCADLVYANKSWVHPLSLPTNIKFFGLVDEVYNPRNTIERLSHTFGTTRHLMEDFAESCGFTVTVQQRKLYPSVRLIEKTRVAYGLHRETVAGRLLIGINPGPNWRVKEWAASKWQMLINKIHSEYDAVIIQFGTNKGDGSSEYDYLTGVESLASRLNGEALLAVIAVCDLIISIDSGPVHLAGTVDTPVIGLFGALNPAFILAPDSPAVALFSDVPCLFCHNKTPVIHWFDGCPHNIVCMNQLCDETVFQAVKSMLRQRNKQ